MVKNIQCISQSPKINLFFAYFVQPTFWKPRASVICVQIYVCALLMTERINWLLWQWADCYFFIDKLSNWIIVDALPPVLSLTLVLISHCLTPISPQPVTASCRCPPVLGSAESVNLRREQPVWWVLWSNCLFIISLLIPWMTAVFLLISKYDCPHANPWTFLSPCWYVCAFVLGQTN